jgi:hypothetical protein
MWLTSIYQEGAVVRCVLPSWRLAGGWLGLLSSGHITTLHYYKHHQCTSRITRHPVETVGPIWATACYRPSFVGPYVGLGARSNQYRLSTCSSSATIPICHQETRDPTASRDWYCVVGKSPVAELSHHPCQGRVVNQQAPLDEDK